MSGEYRVHHPERPVRCEVHGLHPIIDGGRDIDGNRDRYCLDCIDDGKNGNENLIDRCDESCSKCVTCHICSRMGIPKKIREYEPRPKPITDEERKQAVDIPNAASILSDLMKLA